MIMYIIKNEFFIKINTMNKENKTMGIKNLSQFLKKYKVTKTFSIEKLKYRKVGIDTPMFLFKFKSITEPSTNDWLGCFITFIAFLRKWDVHPIFVIEGKAPPEKSITQEERRDQRQKMIDKTTALENDLEVYISTGKISDILFQTWEKFKHKNNKSLLLKKPLSKTFINVEAIKDEINRRKRYEINITSEDIVNLKKLFDLMGVSWIQSKCEAETDCVSLFYDGMIDYIVAEDTDVLAYYNSLEDKDLKVITTFNITELTFNQISKNMVLETLNLTQKSFTDFCIMCGTDYNKNIFRVGTETSYKFISKWYNIENIPLDTTILNHIRVREIFNVKSNFEIHDKIRWCRFPNLDFIDNLSTFMFTYNIKNINVEFIFKALSESDIFIEKEI